MTATENAHQTYAQALAAKEAAAQALYRAELAVHDAHQTHIDQWIGAAHDRLHVAVSRYLAAESAVAEFQQLAVGLAS